MSDYLRLNLPTRVPAVIPNVDYAQPSEEWSQTKWNDEVRSLVIRPWWAILMMHQVKLVEQRTKACCWTGKPCMIKASKPTVTIDEIQGFLDTKGVRETLMKIRLFKDKLYDYHWWVDMCNFYKDKFLFLAVFSNQPDKNINYSWKGVGAGGKWNKMWYIKKLTKLKGNRGMLYGKKERFGFPGLIQITLPYVKTCFINHARV